MEKQIESPLVDEFRRVTQAYINLQKLVPDTSPEKHNILTKLIESQMWIKFHIDILEAEKNNPVKVGVSKKPKMEVVNGSESNGIA